MSPYVKELVKETGMSERDIKPVWKKAKEITVETFNKEEEDFTSKEYNYTLETARRMLGLDESILDPTNFLKSESSAKEYIDSLMEVQVSGDFGIDKTLNPPEEETPEEEEMPDVTTRENEIGNPPDTEVSKQPDEEMEEKHSPDADTLDETAAATLDDLIEKQLKE
jgi:hypothetical protein